MALKPDRDIYVDDMDYTCDTAAEAGQVLILKSSQGTGHAVGRGINEAAPQGTIQGTGTPASGTIPVGILGTDVEDIDQSKYQRATQRVTAVKGENVYLIKSGKILTNMISGTPAPGDKAYLAANSKLSPTQSNSIPALGEFITSKDSNGFAWVRITMA